MHATRRTLRRLLGWTAAILLSAGAAAAQTTAAPAPSVELLLGAGEAEARIRLGEPDIARREAGGAIWTFARPNCVLFLYFRPEARGALRIVGAGTGPRRRGEAAPGVEACLAAVARDKRAVLRPG